MHGAFFVGMLRTRVDRNRAPRRRLVGVQWLGCVLLLWSWWCVAKGRVFSLSNDIELVMVSEEVRARYE